MKTWRLNRRKLKQWSQPGIIYTWITELIWFVFTVLPIWWVEGFAHLKG